MPPEHTVEAPASGIAHIYKPKRRFQNRYLLLADYRQLDLIKIIADGDLAALAFLARAPIVNRGMRTIFPLGVEYSSVEIETVESNSPYSPELDCTR